jgi:hypothetical protein
MSKRDKKANLTLDGKSTGLTIVEKFPFEDVDFVFDGLFNAFHPDGINKDDDEGPDPRFLALWTLFLASAGWTEDEYWTEQKQHDYECEKCAAERKAAEEAAGTNKSN